MLIATHEMGVRARGRRRGLLPARRADRRARRARADLHRARAARDAALPAPAARGRPPLHGPPDARPGVVGGDGAPARQSASSRSPCSAAAPTGRRPATQPAAPDGRARARRPLPRAAAGRGPADRRDARARGCRAGRSATAVLASGGRVRSPAAAAGAVALSLRRPRGRARSLGRSDATVASGGRRGSAAACARRHPLRGHGDGQVHARVARWAWIAGVVGSSLLVEDEHGLRLGASR